MPIGFSKKLASRRGHFKYIENLNIVEELKSIYHFIHIKLFELRFLNLKDLEIFSINGVNI